MSAQVNRTIKRPINSSNLIRGVARSESSKRGVLAQTVGFHIARAAVVAYEAFERHIGEPYDLRKVDYSLLMLLREHERLAPKRLTRLLALTPPKLSMVLERLQSRGLILRSPDPTDRRSVQVALTGEGAMLAEQLEPVARVMERGLRQRLSSAEHAELIRLLEKLADGDEARRTTAGA